MLPSGEKGGGGGGGGGDFLAHIVQLLVAILKHIKLRFPNIVHFCVYPWLILWQNFCKIGTPEGLLKLFFKQEVTKTWRHKIFHFVKNPLKYVGGYDFGSKKHFAPLK